MKAAAAAEFYDARLARPGTALFLDADVGPYAELYRQAAAMVEPEASVVELGCGAGRFARKLVERGIASYVGLDFAVGHVAEASRHVPAAEFRVADLRTDPIPKADTYVALEVLEHLDDDRGLLAELPQGSTVVLSVPSFDSESHVRWFPARGDAVKRYAPLLAIDLVAYVVRRPGVFFHLMRGRRR